MIRIKTRTLIIFKCLFCIYSSSAQSSDINIASKEYNISFADEKISPNGCKYFNEFKFREILKTDKFIVKFDSENICTGSRCTININDAKSNEELVEIKFPNKNNKVCYSKPREIVINDFETTLCRGKYRFFDIEFTTGMEATDKNIGDSRLLVQFVTKISSEKKEFPDETAANCIAPDEAYGGFLYESWSRRLNDGSRLLIYELTNTNYVALRPSISIKNSD